MFYRHKNGIAHATRNPGPRFARGRFRYVYYNFRRRIEMRVLRVTVAGALILFAATAGFAMSVKSDYEKSFDFSQLHTFAFKTDRGSNDPLSTNTLEAGRIQNALAAQLEANGFTQATGNPDFIVAFYSRSKQETQVQSTGGFG